MIKRLNKSKKSKKGAILVIVVLILALAMIFIASAMMLTQATRRRLYDRTMESQARLTVTAASEVFLEALGTQELTDTMLDSVLNKTHGSSNSPMKMVVEGVPGMSEADNNCTLLDIYESPESSEIVICDFSTTIGEEKENVRVYLKINEEDPSYGSRFTNQIEVDANLGVAELRFTEGVGMWNKTKVKKAPSDNTIVMKGGMKAKTDGSIVYSDIIFGKNCEVWLGGGDKYYGKMIFLENSQMVCRSNAQVKGDVYLIGTNDLPGMKIANQTPFGDGKQEGMWDTIAGNTNQKFIFSGRTIQNDTNDGNKKIKDALSGKTCYFLNANGTCRSIDVLDGDGSVLSSTKVEKVKGKNGSGEGDYEITNTAYSASSTSYSTYSNNAKSYQGLTYAKGDSLPTVSTVFKDLCPDGKVDEVTTADFKLPYETHSPDGKKTYPALSPIPIGDKYVVNPVTASYPTYKMVDGKPEHTLYIEDVVKDVGAEGGVYSLDAGYYYIKAKSGSTVNPIDNDNLQNSYKAPYIIAINGANAGDYRFYFAKDTEFILNRIVFAIYNVTDETKPVLFILEQGAKIQLSSANFNDESKLCTAGFISINRASTAAGLATYINGHSYSSECNAANYSWADDYDKTFSDKYDGVVIPKMFIYGAGGNCLVVANSALIEAYVGLYAGASGSGYGNSMFGVIDGTSTILPIYGRIEANEIHGFKNTASSRWQTKDEVPVGKFQMPYCPQPTVDKDKNPVRPAKSKYNVVDIIYYYE